MRRAALLLTALVGAFAFAVSRGSLIPSLPQAATSQIRPSPTPALPEPVADLGRDPFEYASSSSVRGERPSVPAVSLPSLEGAPPKTTAPVRLIGFVQQAGRMRAALVIDGETVLLAAGESALGYTLEAADEQSGARLRTPDGSDLAIAVPE